jgi:uncharacterized membrane protein
MKIKELTIVALLIALNIALSFYAKIPTATGFVSLVEAGIVLAAWLFGARSGAVVGGATGFLLDLLSGYPQWMFFSLLIHGTEGYLFGKVKNHWLGGLIGGIVMVLGYWLAGAIFYTALGGGHLELVPAVLASATEMPANALQVIAGFVLATIVYRPVKAVLQEQ